jgi:hypothetical protein
VIKPDRRCISCKHKEIKHEHRNGDCPELDDICWECNDFDWKKYHTFQLDNLKYIEQLAQAKGLI